MMQFNDKDGDLIPDRLDSTFDPPVYRRQEQQDKYIKAFISPEEYCTLQNHHFSFSRCKAINAAKVAVAFKAKDKAEYDRILSSQRGKQIMKRR